MKKFKISFLLFCLTFLVSNRIFCQETDSLAYYSNMIWKPKAPNDLANAYNFFITQKAIFSTKHQVRNEIYASQNLADLQKKLGYTDESERLNLEILSLLESVETDEWTTQVKVKTLNDLGRIYRQKSDYREALKFYTKALDQTNKPEHLNIIDNNIGFVYLQQGQLERALEKFDLAYKNSAEIQDTINMARALDNRGFTKSKLHKKDAKEDLLNALSLRQTKNYRRGMATSYEHLAEYFNTEGDLVQAQYYADKAIDLAYTSKNLEQIRSALRLKINLGDSKVSSEYLRINDSITAIEQANRNDFNYYVYQYDKKEKELQASKLINAEQKNRDIISIFLVAFLILLFIGIYFILKYKHKKEKLQQVYLTETRISQKVHDEVANDIYHVMTKLQTSSLSQSNVLDDLDHIYTKTRDISRENNAIDNEEDFEELLHDLLVNYKNDHLNVITKDSSKINWNVLNHLKKVTLYRVLQELMVNTRKHSHATLVVLSFQQTSKNITINYSDNGIGCELKHKNGLQNAETRIISINGTITFDSQIEKGFKATIII